MSRARANLLLLITAFIWGTAFVAQQSSLEDLGPFYFTAIRFIIGGLLVLPFGLRELKRLKADGHDLSRKHWWSMALVGSFLFLGSISQQIGLKHTSVTNAGFLTGLYVPLVPVLMLLVWRKLPHWSIWPSALGCLVGTYYLSGGNFQELNTGDLYVLAGAICWALQVIFLGFLVKSTQTPVLVASVQFIFCGLIALIGAVTTETVALENLINAGPELFYASVMSVSIAFTLQAIAQRHTPQADAAIIMSGEILFAALAGALIQGDRLSVEGYIGCAIMFMSILSVELLPLVRKKRQLAAR